MKDQGVIKVKVVRENHKRKINQLLKVYLKLLKLSNQAKKRINLLKFSIICITTPMTRIFSTLQARKAFNKIVQVLKSMNLPVIREGL